MHTFDPLKVYLAVFSLFMLPLAAAAQEGSRADSLFQRGISFYNSGNLDRAEPLFERAHALFREEGDSTNWLSSGLYLAEILNQRSRLERSIQLYRELLEEGGPLIDDYYRGFLHSGLGLVFNRQGKLDSALTHFESALPPARKSGDIQLIGSIYNNLGQTYRLRGEYAKSLDYRRQALDFFRDESRDSSGNALRENIARALNNIGMLYHDLGLYDRALEQLNESLKIRLRVNNVSNLATIYDNIGLVQKEMGHYDQALVAYQKSLEYRRQAGQPAETAQTLNNIGVLYSAMGDPETALDYYRRSLDLLEGLEVRDKLASIYRNVGNRMWDLDRREEALTYYRQSLEYRREIGNPHDLASSYWDLAKVNMERGNFNVASMYLAESRHLADSTGSAALMADADFWEGRLAYARENFGEALTLFKRSYRQSRNRIHTRELAPLIWISNTFDRIGSDSTLWYGRRAVELIERNREQVGAASRMRQDYLEQYAGFYLSLASRTIDHSGSVKEAYELVEASKARTLSDDLQEASLGIGERLPEEVRLERNSRLDRLHQLYLQRQSLEDTAGLDSLNRLIQQEEFSFAAYQNELSDSYEEYKQLRLPEPVSLEQARELCPSNTAILEYAVTPRDLLIFVITPDNAIVRSVSLQEGDRGPGELLTEKVRQFRQAIVGRESLSEINTHSEALYRLLLEPVEEQLEPHRQLIIVPDGPLAYLPFEALREGGQYLIEERAVKYAPSLTSLQLLESKDRESREELLAVAGSDFAPSGSLGGEKRQSLSLLPSTVTEIDSIASYFGRATLLKGNQVSEGRVKQILQYGSFRYIHLATHGLIDEDQPALSGLSLRASGEIGATSSEDGLLRSSEIYRLNLDTRLVVLSACNTGMGKLVNGEGILGMQRSFFYAGAPAVVVSLWNVYDRSTSHLMRTFYKNLTSSPASGNSLWERFSRWAGWERSIPYGEIAGALREAKLEMIAHPRYHHPVYWAPFISVGR